VSEDEREDSDDVAWLLARERGEPGPIVSAATSARYERLQALIKDLPAMPAGVPPRAGWQRDVLAAIDAGEAEAEAPSEPAAVRAIDPPPKRTSSSRRRWAAAMAIFAVAAVVVIVLAVSRDRGPGVGGAAPTLAFEVQPVARAHRGTDASAGDTAIARGVVDGPGELRVYDAAGIEQARCAAPAPDCTVDRSGTRTTLRLTMPLQVPGTLRAILLPAPLGGPSNGMDADIGAAVRAGMAVTSRELEVH
jgi:hypothetical protein